MELYTASELRRNERLDRALSKKPQTSAAPEKQSGARAPDRCTLSRQALAYLERQNALRLELEERRARERSRVEAALGDMESKEKQLELLKKAMDTMRKCMKIAASIMKGNRVPAEDLKYLMDNDPEGYKLALAMRRNNPDPKDEKSVLDDEDRGGARAGDAGSSEGARSCASPDPAPEAPSAEAPAAAE